LILAGLLTYSLIVLKPSQEHSSSHEEESCSVAYTVRYGAYSSGSVQDLHLIPFSPQTKKMACDTKTAANVGKKGMETYSDWYIFFADDI
jgi:hypothetical protein